MKIIKVGKDMVINIPSAKIKQFYRGNLMFQIDETSKYLIDTNKLKILIKKPLNTDIFSKTKPCVYPNNMI